MNEHNNAVPLFIVAVPTVALLALLPRVGGAAPGAFERLSIAFVVVVVGVTYLAYRVRAWRTALIGTALLILLAQHWR